MVTVVLKCADLRQYLANSSSVFQSLWNVRARIKRVLVLNTAKNSSMNLHTLTLLQFRLVSSSERGHFRTVSFIISSKTRYTQCHRTLKPGVSPSISMTLRVVLEQMNCYVEIEQFERPRFLQNAYRIEHEKPVTNVSSRTNSGLICVGCV